MYLCRSNRGWVLVFFLALGVHRHMYRSSAACSARASAATEQPERWCALFFGINVPRMITNLDLWSSASALRRWLACCRRPIQPVRAADGSRTMISWWFAVVVMAACARSWIDV